MDLTPARHTRVVPAATQPDEQAKRVEDLRDRLRRANTQVATIAEATPTTSAGDAPRQWRSATVADLLRGGALTLLRSRPLRGSLGQAAAEPGEEIAGEAVLTARDVATRRTASGVADETYSGEEVRIETGDSFSRKRCTTCRAQHGWPPKTMPGNCWGERCSCYGRIRRVSIRGSSPVSSPPTKTSTPPVWARRSSGSTPAGCASHCSHWPNSNGTAGRSASCTRSGPLRTRRSGSPRRRRRRSPPA